MEMPSSSDPPAEGRTHTIPFDGPAVAGVPARLGKRARLGRYPAYDLWERVRGPFHLATHLVALDRGVVFLRLGLLALAGDGHRLEVALDPRGLMHLDGVLKVVVKVPSPEEIKTMIQ